MKSKYFLTHVKSSLPGPVFQRAENAYPLVTIDLATLADAGGDCQVANTANLFKGTGTKIPAQHRRSLVATGTDDYGTIASCACIA
jgi:hypothetical protein